MWTIFFEPLVQVTLALNSWPGTLPLDGRDSRHLRPLTLLDLHLPSMPCPFLRRHV